MDELKAAYRTWLLAEQAHCVAWAEWLALCVAEFEGQPATMEQTLRALAKRREAQQHARRCELEYQEVECEYARSLAKRDKAGGEGG